MPCPICQHETVHKYRPFCSVECANRDLHNWLHEAYSLEVDDENLEEGDSPNQVPQQKQKDF